MNNELKNILKSSTLLLVEDDERVREKFSMLLGIYVGKIYEANNGKKALELYKKYNPSFIITDIEMSSMDGLEFIKILRKDNQLIPIVITSAYSHQEYLLESIKLTLVDYLIKPINHNNLMVSLEAVAKILKKNTLSNAVVIDGCIYNPANKTVSVECTTNHLTNSESQLLELLILHRGNVVTKAMIESRLYVYKEMSDSAVKNLMFKLRKKLVKDIIISVDRIGYMIL